MKEEVNTILEHLECEKEREMSLLRNQLLSLSQFRSAELQQNIDGLLDAIKQTNIQSHKYTGYYYFFLGCAYYEQGQYPNAISSLQSAVTEMWGIQKNKALARWLLGLSHSNLQDFSKARNELQEALKLLATHTASNSLRTEREYKSRQTIQQKIKDKLDKLFNEPLFRTVQAEPDQRADRFPVQNPPESEDKGASVSISITSENRPNIKTSANVPLSGAKPEKADEENTNKHYETRTDDDGYLIIQSVPVFEEYTRAGKSDEPKPIPSKDKFAEFHQVNIEDVLYSIHSLRSDTKRINLTRERNWGWIKVKGKSMNHLKGKQHSIDDGDYVLFQENPNANDNDIVIAVDKDNKSTHVKRLRKLEKMLYSESTEKGEEYKPIDMRKNNMEIKGIVYAVAKPIIPQPY